MVYIAVNNGYILVNNGNGNGTFLDSSSLDFWSWECDHQRFSAEAAGFRRSFALVHFLRGYLVISDKLHGVCVCVFLSWSSFSMYKIHGYYC